MIIMAGGLVENKRKWSVCVPNGFPADVKPLPPSGVGVDRS